MKAVTKSATVLALLLAGVWLSLGRVAAQEDDPAPPTATVDASFNPHGRADGCASCHSPGSDGAPGAPMPTIENCRGCHPDADMHPVGMPSIKAPIPAGWATEGDDMVCSTCHAEPACDPERPQAPPFLRGGPYSDPEAICWRCHIQQEHGRTDPHHPQSHRFEGDQTCVSCHSGLPEAGAPPERSRLRLQGADVCSTCHELPQHLGVESHLGKKLGEYRTALDETTWGALMAFDEGGVIQCWTCHEVHGDGDLLPPPQGATRGEGLPTPDALWRDETSPTRRREETRDHPPLLATAVAGGNLCRACHGNGPK